MGKPKWDSQKASQMNEKPTEEEAEITKRKVNATYVLYDNLWTEEEIASVLSESVEWVKIALKLRGH